MKRFIIKKATLVEYVQRKKSEKLFYEIVEQLHKNIKFLNENVSIKNANQSVIDHYKNKNLINPMVNELLIKHNIINEDAKII